MDVMLAVEVKPVARCRAQAPLLQGVWFGASRPRHRRKSNAMWNMP